MLSISRANLSPLSLQCGGCNDDMKLAARSTVHALHVKLGLGPISRRHLCRSCLSIVERFTDKFLCDTPDVSAFFAARVGGEFITLPDGSAFANATYAYDGPEDLEALRTALTRNTQAIRFALCPALWLFYLMRADASFCSFDSLLRIMAAGRMAAPLGAIDGPIGLHGPNLTSANILMVRTSRATGELIGYAKIAGVVRALGVLAPADEALKPSHFLFVYDLVEDRDRTREFQLDPAAFENSMAAWRLRQQGTGF